MNCNHNNNHRTDNTNNLDNTDNPHGHNYLRQPTVPTSVEDKSIAQLTDDMLLTGFQGRRLAEAIECWAGMLKEDELTIFMGLSGAMVPAGMRRIISY
ncbi:MAG: deoxyhypusine synthase family protein, partial [Methanosarcinales archaeon]|nr:deoxyhypusine synthase family protein [Methanosarcinales archaeon]